MIQFIYAFIAFTLVAPLHPAMAAFYTYCRWENEKQTLHFLGDIYDQGSTDDRLGQQRELIPFAKSLKKNDSLLIIQDLSGIEAEFILTQNLNAGISLDVILAMIAMEEEVSNQSYISSLQYLTKHSKNEDINVKNIEFRLQNTSYPEIESEVSNYFIHKYPHLLAHLISMGKSSHPEFSESILKNRALAEGRVLKTILENPTLSNILVAVEDHHIAQLESVLPQFGFKKKNCIKTLIDVSTVLSQP